MQYTSDDNITATFRWSRARLYDRYACIILYDILLIDPTVTVKYIESKDTCKWRPKPLATVELQQLASRFLRMSSNHTMEVAEKLYQKGWISYPRTETSK